MSVKRLHIALLMMAVFLCAPSTYGQKPLTKPEKPQVQAPIIAKSSHKKKQVTAIEDKAQAEESKDETIPEYQQHRDNLYDALTERGINIGDKESFDTKIDSKEHRDKLYNALSKKGIKWIGSRDEFEAKLAKPERQ